MCDMDLFRRPSLILSMATSPVKISQQLSNPVFFHHRRYQTILMYYFRHTSDYSHWAKEFASFVPDLPLSSGNRKEYGAKRHHRFPAEAVFMLLWGGIAEDHSGNPARFHHKAFDSAAIHASKGDRQGRTYLDWESLQPSPADWFKFAWDLHQQVSDVLTKQGSVSSVDVLPIANSLLGI